MSTEVVGFEREPKEAFEPIHFDDLLKRVEEVDVETVFNDILNKTLPVEGMTDTLSTAEDFLRAVDKKWFGENTLPLWERLKEENEMFLALSGQVF